MKKLNPYWAVGMLITIIIIFVFSIFKIELEDEYIYTISTILFVGILTTMYFLFIKPRT